MQFSKTTPDQNYPLSARRINIQLIPPTYPVAFAFASVLTLLGTSVSSHSCLHVDRSFLNAHVTRITPNVYIRFALIILKVSEKLRKTFFCFASSGVTSLWYVGKRGPLL